MALTPITRYGFVVAFLCSCGGSGAKDPADTTTVTMTEDAEPSIEESRERVARLAALYGALGDGVDVAASDCDAVAASIAGWSQRNEKEVVRLAGELETTPAEQVRELVGVLEDAMRRAALQVRDGSDRCQGHEAVFDSISKLPK